VIVAGERIPKVINLGFLDRSRYFSFKHLLSCPHEAEWTPFEIRCFSENLVAPGIEPGTSGHVARNSDHQTTEAVEKILITVTSFKNLTFEF
jgi:hypothetical protein